MSNCNHDWLQLDDTECCLNVRSPKITKDEKVDLLELWQSSLVARAIQDTKDPISSALKAVEFAIKCTELRKIIATPVTE